MNNPILKAWIKTECKVYNGMDRAIRRFHREESGAGVAEYGLLVGLAVLVGLGILRLFWAEISALFNRIITALQTLV